MIQLIPQLVHFTKAIGVFGAKCVKMPKGPYEMGRIRANPLGHWMVTVGGFVADSANCVQELCRFQNGFAEATVVQGLSTE
jgi:hypothetical protein